MHVSELRHVTAHIALIIPDSDASVGVDDEIVPRRRLVMEFMLAWTSSARCKRQTVELVPDRMALRRHLQPGETVVIVREGDRPSMVRILIAGNLWRLPTSNSLKSCAGVILTARLPFSGSEYSSATTAILRPTIGRG